MEQVYRCYAEKRTGFDVEAEKVWRELKEQLGIANLEGVRIICRYDVDQVDKEVYEMAKTTVFSEPMVDDFYDETMPPIQGPHALLIVEALPGQFDQRADSCAQCIQLLAGCDRPLVKAATVYVLLGDLSDEDCEKISRYLINPVESTGSHGRKAQNPGAGVPHPHRSGYFGRLHRQESGRAEGDALHLRPGYGSGRPDLPPGLFPRRPSIGIPPSPSCVWWTPTGLTTAATPPSAPTSRASRWRIPQVQAAYDQYLAERVEVYGQEKADQRPKTLMDIGTSGTKVIKKRGERDRTSTSPRRSTPAPSTSPWPWTVRRRIGCSMFKNETHNHPTEIEPFGGAATCVGGAIRDPLSGRAYVYQAMRVTGCGDPRTPMSETIKGQVCPSANWPPLPPQAIPPTATRSAWPPASCRSIITPAMWPSTWSWVRS